MSEPPTSNPLASEYDRARAEFEYIHSCKPTEPEHHGWIAGYCAALRDARLADETTPVLPCPHKTIVLLRDHEDCIVGAKCPSCEWYAYE